MEIEDKELLEEFVVESKEHLDSIEDNFLELEKQKDNPDLELVNKVFRPIHSIKGTSGFLNLERMAQLSHSMETILSKIREGEMKPYAELVDALLKGVDMLNTMLDDIENSNEMDIAELDRLLKSHLEEAEGTAGSKAGAAETKSGESAGVKSGFEGGQVDLDEMWEKYPYIYILKYDLHSLENSENKPVWELLNDLLSVGEICATRIETDKAQIKDGQFQNAFTLEVCFATILEPGLLAPAVFLEDDFITPLQREKQETPVKVTKEAKVEKVERTPISNEPETEVESKDAGRGKAIKCRESIRINIDLLDKLMTQASELVLVRNQNLLYLDKNDSNARGLAQRLDVITTDLQKTIMATRMQPIGNVLNKFPRIIRDLGKKLGKQIAIEITGSDVELDKTILEALTDPLTHLIRNCCDHGIENPDTRIENGKELPGMVWLSAYHEEGQVNIKIKDNGKGIDPQVLKTKALEKNFKSQIELDGMSEKELLNLILLPGFSTAGEVSDVSGRGVGMDVVRTSIENLGGILELHSQKGKGTTVHMRLPLTLAIIPSLIVNVDNERFAIPEVNLEELVCLYDEEVKTKIETAAGKEVFRLRDQLIPMVRLSEVLKSPSPFSEERWAKISRDYRDQLEESYQEYLIKKKKEPNQKFRQSINFAVIKVGINRFGLIVDEIIGTEEIVVKPMHHLVSALTCYSGATIMGDGGVALILDLMGIAKFAGISWDKLKEDEEKERRLQENGRRHTQVVC
ncbi:chemotaxis protein CheA [Candidatus Riflebacteria bacterium]